MLIINLGVGYWLMFKGLHYDMFMINFDLENNSDKLCPIEGPG